MPAKEPDLVSHLERKEWYQRKRRPVLRVGKPAGKIYAGGG